MFFFLLLSCCILQASETIKNKTQTTTDLSIIAAQQLTTNTSTDTSKINDTKSKTTFKKKKPVRSPRQRHSLKTTILDYTDNANYRPGQAPNLTPSDARKQPERPSKQCKTYDETYSDSENT